MKLINLHRKYTFVDYQHHLCSCASLITFLALFIAIILPIFAIIQLNNSQNYFIVYEQPMVKFQYKYLIFAENTMQNEESKEILCSSFDFLQQYDNDTLKCSKIKVTEKYTGGLIDEIIFTVDFHTFHNYGIKTASIVLFLDSRIYDQCELRIPTMVKVNKKFHENFNDRKILISGKLAVNQDFPLACPFFLRKIKSHFFYEKLHENQTNLEEYEINTIQQRIEHNPMYFKFQETSFDMKNLNEDKTSIKIRITVPEIAVRYKKTFWQKLMDFWIQFASLFAITFTIINLILTQLFEKRWIMARRKNYVKDKEF